MTTRLGVRWAPPLIALSVAVLAGCGGTAGGSGVASLTGNDQSASPTASAPATNPEDQIRKFAQCMREHGVNVPDPKPGGKGGVLIQGGGPGDKEKVDKAQQACKQYLPNGGEFDPNDPKILDSMLKLARCLREHGLDVPDPKPGEGIQIPAGGKNDPKVRAAMEACGPAAGGGGRIETHEDGR